jgi:N utilization substance protein B
MPPKRIARELAFLCLTQTDSEKGNLPDMLRAAAKCLREECEESLQQATADLQQSHEQLFQSEVSAKDIDQARTRIQLAITHTQQAINGLGTMLDLPERVVMADQREVREFALALLRAHQKHHIEVQEVISKAMIGWSWERLGRVEQDLLRLCVTELLTFSDIPAKVSISEAVELAKRYGGESTPSFVNGVLRRVMDSLHRA